LVHPDDASTRVIIGLDMEFLAIIGIFWHILFIFE